MFHRITGQEFLRESQTIFGRMYSTVRRLFGCLLLRKPRNKTKMVVCNQHILRWKCEKINEITILILIWLACENATKCLPKNISHSNNVIPKSSKVRHWLGTRKTPHFNYSPKNMNIEAENHPFETENHLPNLHFGFQNASCYMHVSENSGFPPNSSILIGFSNNKPSILGGKPPIFGNPHIVFGGCIPKESCASKKHCHCTTSKAHQAHLAACGYESEAWSPQWLGKVMGI